MNTMLKLNLGSVRVSFQKCIANIENRYNTPFYTNLHDFVPRHYIHHIGKELESGVKLQRDHAQNQQEVNLQVCQVKVNQILYLRGIFTCLNLLVSCILTLITVSDDGNCGFRAIVTLLGWSKESWFPIFSIFSSTP